MSRFGDLIRGKSASAPAPVVEEAPAPVVEEEQAPVAKKKNRREEVEQEWEEATGF